MSVISKVDYGSELDSQAGFESVSIPLLGVNLIESYC